MKMFEGEFFFFFLGVLNGGVFMMDIHCDLLISTRQDTNLITLYMQTTTNHCNSKLVRKTHSAKSESTNQPNSVVTQ